MQIKQGMFRFQPRPVNTAQKGNRQRSVEPKDRFDLKTFTGTKIICNIYSIMI
jgi:hypothetical protein